MRRLFLGEYGGDSWITAIDGPHSEPEGVARAAKLYREVFNRSGNFVMIEVQDLSDVDPPINEEAATDCCALLSAESSHETGRPYDQRAVKPGDVIGDRFVITCGPVAIQGLDGCTDMRCTRWVHRETREDAGCADYHCPDCLERTGMTGHKCPKRGEA